MNNQLYIPHVTKMTAISICFYLCFCKNYFNTYIKRCKIKKFNIIDYFNLLLISVIIDSVKLLAFAQSSLINLLNKYKSKVKK